MNKSRVESETVLSAIGLNKEHFYLFILWCTCGRNGI